MGGAANTAMGMGGSTVTFASGATNSVGQAMIGAKNSTVQAGMQVASQSLGFMTGMAGQIAGELADLSRLSRGDQIALPLLQKECNFRVLYL